MSREDLKDFFWRLYVEPQKRCLGKFISITATDAQAYKLSDHL